MNTISPIEQLHATYCRIMNYPDLPLRLYEQDWRVVAEWVKPEDFEVGLVHLLAENRKLKAAGLNERVLRISRLAQEIEDLVIHIAEAKRRKALKIGPKQQAVNEFRGYREPPSAANTSRLAKDILKGITE